MTGFSLRRWFDGFRGAGHAAVTIPSMDGALGPNSLLERADVIFEGEGIANLAKSGDRVYFSVGRTLHALADLAAAAEIHSEYAASITALAARGDGALAVGLSGDGIVISRPGQGDLHLREIGGKALNCPTALAFADDDALMICNGSATNTPGGWRRDLMERNRSGSVWRLDLKSGANECLANGLGYPAGVATTPSGKIVISESWLSRLVTLEPKGNTTLVEDLPGYPGTISPADDGGYWLSVFAPRRQIIEFILREDAYRKSMMETLPEAYWVAPALRSGDSYFEPVQGGGVRHLGILKPWAPTRSYGLLVQCDAEFNAKASFHSRADGVRHGITSAIELGDRVLATSSGAGLLLAIDPTMSEE